MNSKPELNYELGLSRELNGKEGMLSMAEEKAAPAPTGDAGGAKASKPILLIVLLVVNMLVVAGVGFMLHKNRQMELAKPSLDKVVQGEAHAQEEDHKKEEEASEVGKVLPLETFIVNLAGSKGRKVAKVNIEVEVLGEAVANELEKRKAQIRDIIIILLSSKTYDEVSTREGKENLRAEILQNVNAFLVSGKISNIFFTEFIYN